MKLLVAVTRAIDFVPAVWNSIRARIYRSRFSKIGKNVSFDARGIYSYENIEIGNDVNLGYRPILIAAKSKIVIGDHVMFGPEVTVRGGNHRIDIVGRNMIAIGGSEKRPEDDPGVVIEDDVWIGTRAVILAGVRVGRGAVVGAGAVVTKSVPPYAIVGGNPARVIRMRFSPEDIAEHERLLADSKVRRVRGEAAAGIARNRRILAGIAGGVVGRAVSLLAPFIVMPVLLRHLGHADFGVWMTALSITSMTMFVDLGIGNGLLTRLSSAYGRGDNEEMRGLISSAYASLTAIALLLLVLLFVVLAVARTGFLTAEGLGDSAGVSIVAVCLAAFIAGIPASIIQKVFYSHQMVWLGNAWQVVAAAVSVVACLAAVKLGWGAWQAIAAYSVPPVVLMLVAAAVFFRRRPEIAPSIASVDVAKIRMLLAIGSRFLVLGIVTSVALNADNVIIAQKLGAAAVTEYAVPAKLASVLGLMVTTLFLPLWPANGEAIARGDYAWVRASTLRMSLLGGLAVAVAGLCLVLLGKPIMMLWMGRTFSDQQPVLAFLCATFGLMAFTSPFQMLLNSTSRLKAQIYPWVAFIVTTIAAKFLFLDQDKLWLVPMISCIGFAGIVLPSMFFACQALLSERR